MIKILHLITGLSIGGSEMALYRIVDRMDRSRFSNIVVSMTDVGPVGKLIKACDVDVISLNMRRGGIDPGGLWRMIRLLRKERPHILQTWLYHSDLLGMIASRFAGSPPVIWNLRCSHLDKKDHSKALFRTIKFLARLSNKPRAVVVNSKSGEMVHKELGYAPQKWAFIPNGFDVDKFKPSKKARKKLRDTLSLPEDSELIGLVARFDPMKDHATFLKAAANLSKKRNNVVFVLVGKGVDDKNEFLLKLINDLGIFGRVKLLGERPDVAEIIAAFDIAVSASYSEGFPNTIGEAMACGLPCVSTDAGDSANIIGDTGVVVAPCDHQAMAEGMDKLLSMEKSERRALGGKARDRIIEKFSIDGIARQYENLYEETVDID